MGCITSDEFDNQLDRLISSITVKRIKSISKESNYLKLIYNVTKDTIYEISILIKYKINYQSPVLYFRVSKLIDNDIETWINLSNESEIINLIHLRPEFQISIKDLNELGIWWFIHPCDTSELLQNTSNDQYLINWFSIYANWV